MKNLFSYFLVLIALILLTPTCQAETKKILAIGNSFSYDAILQELLPVVRSGGDDIIVGFPYKGGTTLQLHWQYISSKNKIYNYYKIKDGKTTSTGSSSRCFDESIIASEPWDIVVIQTDHNYSGAYDHYFPYLDNIIAYVKDHLTNKNAKFYLYMTWAYQNGSAKLAELVNKGLYENQADQYAKIIDCASRAAVQSRIGAENIIPAGTAVQNGRTSYLGDSYNRDGYHLNLEHGRYTASLTWYAKIFGKNLDDVTYHPAGMSDFCASLCKKAVEHAITAPMGVTSLKEEFGVDPDAKFNAVDRPIYLNFGISAGISGTGAEIWNNLTSNVSGASIRNLFNSKGYGTDVCVSVDEAFDGVATDGSPYSGSEFMIPDKVSTSSFYRRGKSSITISNLYPGQEYDMKVYASAASDSGTTFRFTGGNSGYATLDATSNTAGLATVPNILADKQGRVRFTIEGTDGGICHINALVIIPHLSIPGAKAVRINFAPADSPVPDEGWNNITSYQTDGTVTDLTFPDGSATGITLKLTKNFAGTTTDGETETDTPFDMPSSVSSTGFWVNGVEKDGVLADCAEIELKGLDVEKIYGIQIFGSKANASETYEAEYSTFGKSDNFIALNCNNNRTHTATLPDVMSDADGRLRFTVTPGATSEDTYKVGYINAMTIMVPAMIDIKPFEPVAKDPWDGKSTVQPTVDGMGNYVIYCGAELAWVADQVNNRGLLAKGIKLAKDIDLGSHPWTPIGYDTWFNGNFDGQGYHIRNLYINRDDLSDKRFCGLIGGTNDNDVHVRDLYLSGSIEIPVKVASKTVVGSLIGKANNIGTVNNCHSDVEFIINGTPAYVGGLVGFLKNSEVKSCSFSGKIEVNNRVTNGLGGIAGSTNSSVSGVEAIFNGCIFSGTISYKGSKAPLYVGGINAYSSIVNGSESITNCYVSGSINSDGTNKGIICGLAKTPQFYSGNNYYLDDFGYAATGGIKGTEEDFHSGKIAYLLNGDQSEMLFGQNIDNPSGMPEVYQKSGTNHVFRVVCNVNGKVYKTIFCNSSLKLPEDPVSSGDGKFEGWYDISGNKYTTSSVINTDMELFAHMESGIDDLTACDRQRMEIKDGRLILHSGNGTLSLYSTDGKVIISRNIINAPVQIDLSGLQSGIYIAVFGSQTLKFIR